MYYTLGMTADAAAVHRHEYSTPPTTAPQSKSASTSSKASTIMPPLSSLRSAAISLPSLSSWRPVSAGSAHAPQSLEAILDREAEIDTLSDGGFSGTNSDDVAVQAKRRKIEPKLQTSFQIAHPAPVIRHKQRLKIRPRLVLQLQQLSQSTRPTPALDVLPSVLFAPRLAQRFPRLCKGKEGLGANDLVVVSSEVYESSPIDRSEKHDNSEEESWDHREVVATIRQLKKEEGGARGKVDISLNHGSSWEATPLLNGGYEFVAKEGSQTVARWVPRRPSKRRRSNTMHSGATIPPGEEEKKFNFSIINPNTRRHPIIASITRTTIDILDSYASPSSALASPLRSPSSIRSSQSGYFEDVEVQPRTVTENDEQLRTLIVVTGIWLVFRENWSQNFRYNDAMSVPLLSSDANSHPSNRTRSLNSGDGVKNRTISRDGPSSRHSTLHNLGGMVRQTSTQLLHRAQAQNLQPQRAHSTGTAFMKSVHAVRNRGQSTANRPDQGDFQSATALPHSQGQAAKHRRANTINLSGSAAHVPSSLGPGSTTSSESSWRSGHRECLTDESSKSSPIGQCPDRKDHSTQGIDERLGGEKGMGKLNRLFSIVRRTSSTRLH